MSHRRMAGKYPLHFQIHFCAPFAMHTAQTLLVLTQEEIHHDIGKQIQISVLIEAAGFWIILLSVWC